jgi:type II secretory pathway component PulF
MSTRAGIPISVSVERIRQKINSSSLTQLAERLANGEPVAASFEKVGEFSPFEVNLINVGVQTARLEEVFTHLAEYWSKESELGATLLAQSLYPAIVVHVAIFISGLPGLVQIGFGGFLYNIIYNGFMVYMVCIPAAVVAVYTWHSEAGQKFWMAWPLIGPALISTYVFRWITALRLEYAAGIPLPDAASDAWKASGFIGCQGLATDAFNLIREGNPLSILMKKWPYIPKDWADFVDSGEQAGTLETTFETLGSEASQSALRAQDRLRVWMPRVVFAFLMIIVGFLMMQALFAFLKPISDIRFS